ncbi:MAG: RrF2 family transcriptional regulator [Patescibacteria group bacterium]|jgi:Rrf2 family protein
MLQISLKSEYGLLFLLALHRVGDKKHLSLSAVSRHNHLPYRFLSQIATDLKKAGLVDSKEGSRGGYFLIKDLKTVSLADVIRILDGEMGLIHCQREGQCAREKTCRIKGVWQKVQNEIDGVLSKYSVADLA